MAFVGNCSLLLLGYQHLTVNQEFQINCIDEDFYQCDLIARGGCQKNEKKNDFFLIFIFEQCLFCVLEYSNFLSVMVNSWV